MMFQNSYRFKVPPVQSNFPNNELLAYFKMEETGQIAYSSIGSIEGTFIDPISPTIGKINSGFYFAGGGNKRMSLTNLGSYFSGKTGATFNTWIKLENHIPTVEKYTGIADFNTLTDSTLNLYPYTDGDIYLGFFAQTRKTIGQGIISDRTQWHMITITSDFGSNVWKFYQNAQLVHTSTVGTITYKNFIIAEQGVYTFNGSMDEMSFHTRALTGTEIVAVYNMGEGMTY